MGSLFGMGQQEAPDPVIPDYEPAPDRTTADVESSAVRSEEQRKIRARRAMAGTLLTAPTLGGTSTLGG